MGFISEVPDEISPCSIRSDLYSDQEVLTQLSAAATPPSPVEKGKCPTVIAVLSSLLERAVARNERSRSPSEAKQLTAFHGLRVPTISVEQYLQRIFKYANCSTSCFVVAYTYIDRLMQQQPNMCMTSLNVHRIIITSVLVAVKFLDDMHYNNAYYAQIGGVSTSEMNKLERDFLSLLNFRLHVTVSVFESYCSHLEREVARDGGYQIERALRSVCALDDEVRPQRNPECRRVMVVSGSHGL